MERIPPACLEQATFEVDDLILYSGTGVCRVAAVDYREGRAFYTLAPLYGTETIYVPADAKVFMRPVLSSAEAEALIAQIPSIDAEPVAGQNFHLLGRYYQEALQTHQCTDLIKLIKTTYCRNTQAGGKKPYKLDENYRKRAEDLLHGELAASLGIPRELVGAYITQKLQGAEHQADAG